MRRESLTRSGSLTRRGYLAVAGAGGFGVLAGCISSVGSSSSNDDTLRIGAADSYVNAVSTSAGDWIKKEFEKQYDGVTLKWVVKENEVNEFIQRRKGDAPLKADGYVGVTPTDLVRAERVLGDDTDLFEKYGNVDTSNVVDDYWFDPKKRVVPTGSSYVCIVYDGTKIEEPESFDALLRDEYENGLLLANPQTTVTGLDFLLWTISAKGQKNYLDYWKQLLANGVRVVKSWNTAYSAFESGEAPMVVSYSTDQIYAVDEGKSIEKHRIAFPNDEGYAYVSGLGKFATTDRDDLFAKFARFLLTPRVQRRTAVLNVGIPAVKNASLPKKYRSYAKEPDSIVQYSTDELRKHASEWRSTWARQVASG